MNSELTLYDYWRIINRRKWTALSVFLLTLGSTSFYTRLQPVIYQSQAIIKFQPPASYSKIPGSELTEFDPWNAVSTEIRVITSMEIADRAARKLGWLDDGANPARNAGVVNFILGSCRAERLQDSNLITITGVNSDPVKASDLVNAVIEAYRDYDLEQKSRQGRKTLEDIASRKAEVEENLRALERSKQNFMEKNPNTGLGAALANQLADLEIRKRGLQDKYTPNHPDVIELNQRIKAVESRLGEIPAREVELVRISRELRLQEELYTTLNKQYEEAKLGLSSVVSFVSVVNPAVASASPVSPNKSLNMLIGGILGFFLAIVSVFLLENLDVSISTIEDIESFLKLPVLGIMPHIASEHHLDNWLTQLFRKERYTVEGFRSALLINRRYSSGVIEAYHTLRTNIISQLGSGGSMSLVFSSAGPAEGKTLTAVNFALAGAHAGLKTLLIDADMRRPTVHQIFGSKREPGLSDILTGRTDWRDAALESEDLMLGGLDFDSLMRFQGIENLRIINAGTVPGNIVDIVDSAGWEELLTGLKSEFDLIIFDAPPVLLFVDSILLAKHMDGVVLVYKAGKIARSALRRAKEQVIGGGNGSRMIGVVLNGVRATEMGPQYGYYSSDYKKYSLR
ncbi:MAG TPA: polysaccharide biosynthesis tyrosine autokinase, partial [Elusimicrobiales bacterium]|nr:polysaccharide biosynthesis tyrosine autokinase [Elusimicrobiales bacterium]